jgi:hypothetical protein
VQTIISCEILSSILEKISHKWFKRLNKKYYETSYGGESGLSRGHINLGCNIRGHCVFA